MNETRRLLEMAAMYAWGAEGSPELRDEWNHLYEKLKEFTGPVVFLGKGKFKWLRRLNNREMLFGS